MIDDELKEFEQQVARSGHARAHDAARGRYTQILLAYDGSADARAALERVAAVAGEDSAVTVVAVIPYEAVGSRLDPIGRAEREWQWQCLVEATAYLRGQGIEPFIEAAAGSPASVIRETARSLGADLLVIGRGHGGRWRPSVRRSPVRPAVEKSVRCDTLVVRSEARGVQQSLAGSPDKGEAAALRSPAFVRG